jgi:hypothetical protein
VLGKGVGTRHRWKWHGAKWYRWWEMRRGDARWRDGEWRIGVRDKLWSDHLSTWDRELYAHGHIGAAKSGLNLHHFWAQYASPTDTSLLRKTMVSNLPALQILTFVHVEALI